MADTTKMLIRADALNSIDFQASFEVLDDGRYLIDATGELWICYDNDGTHLTYVRDSRKESTTCH